MLQLMEVKEFRTIETRIEGSVDKQTVIVITHHNAMVVSNVCVVVQILLPKSCQYVYATGILILVMT